MASHLDTFAAALAYPLDDFQIAGCQAVEAERGVLVCAPTGAGKTVVGEFAVSLALSQGTKCFYTTPIKALSNQKYHDLVAAHGEQAVGLLTGDVSINGDAEIVVMTTEVLRNMIYAQSPTLDRLSHVVMDEIHFLADASRGAVWEEVILNLDESVHIVGLSATVSNSEEFGDWLRTVRGDTEVIVSDHRPVPLDQWMMVGRSIYPLFEAESADGVNERLLQKIAALEAGTSTQASYERGSHRGFRSRSEREPGAPARSGIPRAQDRYRPLGRPEVLRVLDSRDMLPAITFIFSRAGCDGALYQCLRSRMVLTTEAEAAEIRDIVDRGVADIPAEDLEVLDFSRWRRALMRGFAAHHAGMLPAFRHIVEELFVKGLVRAVFATETLALGINMPARTVVLEKLIKFDGESHVDLSPAQYTQLTGRAGRRGIDTLGNAVVQWSPAMDPRAVAGLASTRTYPLISTFAPGYNMAINLLSMVGYQQALRLLEKSFAQYQADDSVVEYTRSMERREQAVARVRAEFEQALAQLAPPLRPEEGQPHALLMEYSGLRQELSAEEKATAKDNTRQRHSEVIAILNRLAPGDIIALARPKGSPVIAVVHHSAQRRQDPRPRITTEQGWSGRLDAQSIANPPIIVGRLSLPRSIHERPHKNIPAIQRALRRADIDRPHKMRAQPRSGSSALAKKLRAQIRSHPVHSWPAADREELTVLAHRLGRAEQELAHTADIISQARDTLGRTFERIVALLAELDYVHLDPTGAQLPEITGEGERLALIHNESDLLIAQCLRRGVWDELDPAELAGVVSLTVFENRKTSGGSPEAATEAMAAAMDNTWRIYQELISDEARHNLPATRAPEPAFALAIHQWTAGAPLGYCLAAAADSGAELSPGDFVRWCRQVSDALQQVAKTGYSDEIRARARRAMDAINRGVVALGA